MNKLIVMGLLAWAGLSTCQAQDAAQATQAAQVAQGRAVYARWCVACHGPGQHTPGTLALYVKYQGSVPPVLEHRSGLSVEMLRVFIRRGVSVMPSFRPTEISEPDIDALAAYLQHTSAAAAAAQRAAAPASATPACPGPGPCR